jgi:hypothetical protein
VDPPPHPAVVDRLLVEDAPLREGPEPGQGVLVVDVEERADDLVAPGRNQMGELEVHDEGG